MTKIPAVVKEAQPNEFKEFYEDALSQIKHTTHMLSAYGLGGYSSAPTAAQASKLWMATDELIKILEEVKKRI
tara:strand:- start:381 stop:599 length:219 start_codon:yes stop_codon:yes gene_type:complete